MYLAKKEKFEKIKQRDVAERVGISECTLSRIINNKQLTKKATAYCITKAIDNDAEIDDYFIKKGE